MKLLRDLVFFGSVGFLGLLIDTSVLYALKEVLGPFVSRGFSFLSAVFITWLLNRRLTFQGRPSKLKKNEEFFRYFMLMLIGGVANYLCYAWLVLTNDYISNNLYYAVLVGSVVGMFFNFFSSRIFLFRKI